MVERWKAQAREAYRRGMRRIVRTVPPGARAVVGILLVLGGLLGFLPVLGFWMIPLGVAVILLDVSRLRRWWARRKR